MLALLMLPKILYKHNDMQHADFDARVCMHYAWAASNIWPSYITDPQPGKPAPARKEMIERHGGPDGPDLVPKLEETARKEWAKNLAKDPFDAAWTFAEFRSVRGKGTDSAAWENAWADAASVQIALELGLDDVAGDLLGGLLLAPLAQRGWQVHQLRRQVLQSPRLWQLLSEGWLRKELSVSLESIEAFVDEVLLLLERRLEDGPRRIYKDKTIPELVQLINEASLQAKQLGSHGPELKDDDEEDEYFRLPATFLNHAASEEEIQALESKAQEAGFDALPEDYKNMLRTSNGISHHGNTLFFPVDAVELDDQGEDWQLELLPQEALGYGMNVEIEWPGVGQVVQTGEGGDEGCLWLVRRQVLASAIGIFDKAYASASADDRLKLERAATDLYGGVEEMRALEDVVLRMYHWAAELEVFGGFRRLLEAMIVETSKTGDESEEEEEGGESEGAESEGDEDDDAEASQEEGGLEDDDGVEEDGSTEGEAVEDERAPKRLRR